MITKNRKAYFEYDIIKEYTAGIVLLGSEVKSIRVCRSSINESFIYVSKGECFIKGVHISRINGALHEENKDRKLLLNKKEIENINSQIKEKGVTAIPIELFIKNGKIKVKIGIGKGKKLYNKKESIKEKDIKRQIHRELKM